MRVYVADDKVQRVRKLTERPLVISSKNLQLVPLDLLSHFWGVCFSHTDPDSHSLLHLIAIFIYEPGGSGGARERYVAM